MSRYLFVTGKLAEPSLRATLASMQSGLEYECAVLPISVAALMDMQYISRHLPGTMGCDTIIVPGMCAGDLKVIEDSLGVHAIRGPKCLKDLPAYFRQASRTTEYGEYSTEIIAEIVDAYTLDTDAILNRAEYFRKSGADIIDLGGSLENSFQHISEAVHALKMEGYRVSVDSFREEDILAAADAGVDYVLSVNSKNLNLARKLRCKVVVIPDFEEGLESLERNITQLESWGISYIIDPVLRPVGFGFVDAIVDFVAIRRKFPDAEMLMGTGNLTELTDADSTGLTALMAGIVAELGIQYVLTTEVIEWAHGAVREMDIARRLMHYACTHKELPKHLETGLLTIKDPPFDTYGENELRAMQKKVRDRNYRIFTDRTFIYVFNNSRFIKGTRAQEIFEQLDLEGDLSQSFYLGCELEKAALAIKLGKRYIQEESLHWGYLTS